MALIHTRYGLEHVVTDPDDHALHELLAELRTERGPEPDDQYTEVAVGNAHWSVTAQISGLITFDNIDLLEELPSDLPEMMYLRDIPDETLIGIWQAVVREDRESLLAHPWCQFERLPPYVTDYYRSRK